MLVVAWCCTMGAWAYDFAANGIYYGITSATDKTVEVVSGYARYSGDVTIPATVTHDGIIYQVTSIGNSAFSYCSSLSSITLPESLTSIGDFAFKSCRSLTAIIIPEEVTSIGDYAFIGCNNLAVITLPESLISIGNYSFYNCNSLTAITIPKGVASIGRGTFWGCSSLTAITLPKSLISIGSSAFRDCSSLTAITIPEEVTSIGNSAFSYCSSLTSISTPENLTSISDYAFMGCSSLTAITIPAGVTSIGEYVFKDCNSLQSIDVAEENTNYKSIDGVLLDKDVTTILFYPIGKIGVYEIPEGVTSIRNYAFRDCSSLTAITLPKSLISIGSSAFRDCSSLTAITIPEEVTSIGNSAFRDCSSLTSITLPESLTSIEEYAFRDCISLVSITLPESLSSIGDYAFGGCSSLLSIEVAGGNTNYKSIDGVLFDKNITKLICCPGGKSGSYTIPEGTNSIEDFAFDGCGSLVSISLPEGVTEIGYRTFSSCSSLQEIHSRAITPPTCENDCFWEVDQTTCTLYVPKGTLEAYKAANVWKDFVNIVEEGSSAIHEMGADAMGQAVITASGNGIVVENLPAGTAVTVYTLSGTVVYEGVASGSRTELTLPAGHLYLVKCGQSVTKVAL